MNDIKLEKQLPVITMNFEEVKASLVAGAEKYKNIVVTEEGLKDCKATQKDLASTRIKLDNYRKEVKKEMLKPIDAFESQCKELIALVATVENPIKEGIAVFDQKKKDANKEIAENIIKTAITEHGLNEKYAMKLNVLDKYCNLTAKPTDVKNDVEQRLFLLLQEQQQEEEVTQIIKDTIENVNKNIDAKLCFEDFQSLIDMKASPVKVMQEINARAERIKANEEKAAADKAAKAEKEVLERIAKAEREALLKAEIERKEAERLRLKAIEDAEDAKICKQIDEKFERQINEVKEAIPAHGVEKITIPKAELVETEMYFIEMRVEGNLNEIKALSKFLKDNNYNYIAIKKGLKGEE